MNPTEEDNRLLVIAEIGCGPPFLGNRARMRALLEECRQLGWEIHFAGVKFSDEEKRATLPFVDRWVTDFRKEPNSLCRRLVSRMGRRLGLLKAHTVPGAAGLTEDSIDGWMLPHWVAEARRLQGRERYRCVLVAYVFHSGFFEAFGGDCWKILDTHDVFANRGERLEQAGLQNFWFSTTDREERRGLSRANVVLAIQDAEAAYFRRALGGAGRVEVVGHFVPTVGNDEPVAAGSVVGFLASDNPLNVDALRWFIGKVWPLVVAERPEAQLKVGGRICRLFNGLPASVDLCGSVEAVSDFYRGCRCSINPMRSGTGLKIKTLESLAHGCPVATTSVGAEGLEACRGRGLVVADDAGSMAATLVSWLAEPAAAREQGRRALTSVQELTAAWRTNLRHAFQPPRCTRKSP